MAKFDTQHIRDLSNGILQKIDNLLAPVNSVVFAINILFGDILGRGVVRKGTALVGAQIADGKNILGLYQFILSNGTKHLLAVIDGAIDSALYRYTGSPLAWASESVAGIKAVKHRFLTYLDTVMILDGTNKTSSADGNTWVTTGGNLDIANCPAGKFPIEWKDRVYVAGVTAAPDTVYYSSVPTGGAISWTVQNGFIMIEPYEGQGAITGLGKVPGYLLIFKERALKRWNGYATYPDDLCFIGTPSHESIVLGKTTCFFFSASGKHSLGIYETNGESTNKISRPIQSIIEAIDPANYADVAGFSDGEIAMWSVGDIIYEEITYSNVVILYHLETKTWQALSFPTRLKVFAPYIDGTTLKIIAGNNDGEVIQLFIGTTDNYTGKSAQPISFAVQYHPMEFGNRGKVKNISKVIPFVKNGTGCKLSTRIDETDGFREKKGNGENEYENEITIDQSAHVFEIRLSGTGIGGQTQVIGIDILPSEVTESIKK